MLEAAYQKQIEEAALPDLDLARPTPVSAVDWPACQVDVSKEASDARAPARASVAAPVGNTEPMNSPFSHL